jgi:hypothetical protein
MNLDALFDDLLTSGVTLADPQRLRKLRVLNTVHLVVMMAAPFLGLFYFYTGAVILFYVAVMTGLLMATSLLLLRKTKNIILMGNYTNAAVARGDKNSCQGNALLDSAKQSRPGSSCPNRGGKKNFIDSRVYRVH